MISDSEKQMPGGWLKHRREQAGLSVDDAAAQLNLLRSQVVALEENRFERLAGPAYVVGYLRNYARLLNLDAEAVVGTYYDAFGRPQPAVLQVPPVARQTPGFQHRQQRSYAGVAVAVAVIAGAWWFGGSEKPTPSARDLAESIQVDTAIGTTVIESLEQLPEDEPTRDIVPEVQWSDAASVPGSSSATAPDSVVVTGSTLMPSGSMQHTVVVNENAAQIRFRFSADCWVEVRNGESRVIYSSMKRADDVLELSGKPPFKVTLGYAPGVSVSYNGEPVAIPSSSSHVARIVLGES